MRIRWRNLELPNKVSVDRGTFSETYGVFTVEPFERGFGNTIGNGLRRVLLSSLEGTGVVWMKIPGVQHEFSTIDGVVEDVTDIVLAMKKVRVKYGGDNPIKMTLKASKKGDVTAGMFAAEADAVVINPNLHVCTLSKDLDLTIEVEVRKGRGYVTAEENEYGSFRGASKTTRKDVDQEIGKIWIDSTFSPVQRVRYRTEDTRVGKLTDYDKLIMEIWTDGTIRPDQALVEASKIYRKHLNPFVTFEDAGGPMSSTSESADSGPMPERRIEANGPIGELLAKPISELQFSVRSSNCLEAENITSIGELVQLTELDLLNMRNFGKTSLKEIQQKLESLGLSLGMTVTTS